MSTIFALDHIGSNHSLYRVQQSMKKFCESLREHTKNLIDFEKRNMIPLTKEELKLHHDAKNCYICRKRIFQELTKNRGYQKLQIIAIIQVHLKMQHRVFVILNSICPMREI